MNRIATLAMTALAGATMTLAGTAQAYGAGATHDVFVEEWDGSEHFAAGDNDCVPWAGTFHEVRTGAYRILAAPGGQVDGEYHINGAVDGFVELIPDDPTLPTYTGEYREKVNGIVSGYDEEEGDVMRVGQFRLRAPLTGTDGSKLLITMSGKITMNANGDLVVARHTFDCS